MFAATFAAPPSRYVSSTTSTTGTGASGEMRPTLPQMNSSSMTSPRMRIVFPEKPVRILSRRLRFMGSEKSQIIHLNLGLQQLTHRTFDLLHSHGFDAERRGGDKATIAWT